MGKLLKARVMGGIFKSAAFILLLGLGGAGAATNCDTQSGPECRSKPFPLHRPDPAINEAPALPQGDRFAIAKGTRIDLKGGECAMKAALCHCTNAMIAAKARAIGARVLAAYAFEGAALVKADLGGIAYEIVISREAGCPVIRQRRG
jgi:hypothetical protein